MTVKESKIKQHKQKTLISASLVKIMQGILQIPVANRKAILIRHQIFRHHESVKPVKQRKYYYLSHQTIGCYVPQPSP